MKYTERLSTAIQKSSSIASSHSEEVSLVDDIDEINFKLSGINLQCRNNDQPHFRRNWVLWHLDSDKEKFWDDRLRQVGIVSSMKELTMIYNQVPRPDQLPSRSDFYFFKEGVQPSWNDPSNTDGGRWMVTLSKSRARDENVRSARANKLNLYWLRLMVALANEQFGQYSDQICGGVIISKRSKDVIAVWTKSALADSMIRSIGHAFKKLLDIPEGEDVEYEKHPNSYSKKNLSPVLMIYGLDVNYFNCEKVFNLLCPYGDCLKVKFLKPGSNTCMVQMRSAADTFYVIKYLTGIWLYGNVIQFTSSHQEFVNLYGPRKPCLMPDETPAFIDFAQSRNLRFRSPEIAAKNRMVSPTKQLYFFAAPPSVTEDHIFEIFEYHCLSPRKVVFFSKNNNRNNGTMGIIFFYSVDEAIEGLISCNHAPFTGLPSKTKYPRILKLSFAPGDDDVGYEENGHLAQSGC